MKMKAFVGPYCTYILIFLSFSSFTGLQIGMKENYTSTLSRVYGILEFVNRNGDLAG